ncbi:bifunctional phosphopantothenoylcysteine decarboxylase/phosphopantothenate--cysteine ligase CoaBC, partial [Candidatus Woesearchaeota archaeon]|nr:bifunctional phosphopantothenoylcysteine decarboxylase/phosphopantothenate--cysteine ligase CoaBC [Candidatus Woesearchaeota archaeon]
LADRAYGLLKNADADLVVANDVGRKNAGFNAEKNEVIVVDRNRKSEHIGLADKRVVADRILDLLGGKK